MRSTRTLGGLSVVVLVAVVFMAASSVGQASSKRAGVAAAVVPCSVAALAAAITAANAAGSPTTLELAPDCAYNIVVPATAANGLPVITGDIRLIGGSSLGPAVDVGQPTTTIQRATALAFRLFEVAVGGTLRIQSVRLVNGSAAGGLGGAILNAGTLTVVSSVFFSNAAGNGGGISNSAGANAIVSRSRFSSNMTTGVGGGGIINFGVLLATRTEFSSNTAPINGGAINTQPGGNTTLNQSTVANNTSGGLGGGLSNLGSTSLVNSRVEFNTGSGGGGIATGNANVFLTNTVVENNIPDNCSPLNTIPGCIN